MNIEDRWEAELTASHVARFLYECSKELSGNLDDGSELVYHRAPFAKMESLAHVAIRRIKSRKIEQTPGISKLQEVVNYVLGLCGSTAWASRCREVTAQMFTAGPTDALLELCQRGAERQGTGSELMTPEVSLPTNMLAKQCTDQSSRLS